MTSTVVLGLDGSPESGVGARWAARAAKLRGLLLKLLQVELVRAGEQAAGEHEMDPAGIPSAASRHRRVLLGVDIDSHVIDASHGSSRVVVGRRIRRHPLGVRVGPATHGVLQPRNGPRRYRRARLTRYGKGGPGRRTAGRAERFAKEGRGR